MSDSSYSAATRHRQPYSKVGRPPTLDIVDDDWAADTLSDDGVNVDAFETAISTLLDEGDLDVDAVVVSAGHSGPTSSGAAERRKREAGRWNDMGLDNFDATNATNSSISRAQTATNGASSNNGASNSSSQSP